MIFPFLSEKVYILHFFFIIIKRVIFKSMTCFFLFVLHWWYRAVQIKQRKNTLTNLLYEKDRVSTFFFLQCLLNENGCRRWKRKKNRVNLFSLYSSVSSLVSLNSFYKKKKKKKNSFIWKLEYETTVPYLK